MTTGNNDNGAPDLIRDAATRTNDQEECTSMNSMPHPAENDGQAPRDLFDILRLRKIEDRFTEFHRDNPRVYEVLVESARDYRAKTGHEKCGMSLLVARVRWVLGIETRSEDGFRMNNNFSAFYSRIIMRQEPDLADMFRTRRSIADFYSDEEAA